MAICSASRFRLAGFSSELLFSSNRFGIASSELGESNTGRCTGAVCALTACAATLVGVRGAAGAAATGFVMVHLGKRL